MVMKCKDNHHYKSNQSRLDGTSHDDKSIDYSLSVTHFNTSASSSSDSEVLESSASSSSPYFCFTGSMKWNF